jgi:hypothetical protein
VVLNADSGEDYQELRHWKAWDYKFGGRKIQELLIGHVANRGPHRR